MKEVQIEKIIRQLIKATNAFDLKTVLSLFTADVVIDDVSVGEQFTNTSGIRKYFEQFFVGYHTASKLESIKVINDRQGIVQLDFTGDFGHETGALNVTINKDGLITAIAAHLD